MFDDTAHFFVVIEILGVFLSFISIIIYLIFSSVRNVNQHKRGIEDAQSDVSDNDEADNGLNEPLKS
jgi:hypothetical protein